MAETVKFPDVKVQLTGEDGNVFGVIGRVAKAIRRSEGADAAKAFTDEAFACSSYDAVLRLAMVTVEVS